MTVDLRIFRQSQQKLLNPFLRWLFRQADVERFKLLFQLDDSLHQLSVAGLGIGQSGRDIRISLGNVMLQSLGLTLCDTERRFELHILRNRRTHLLIQNGSFLSEIEFGLQLYKFDVLGQHALVEFLACLRQLFVHFNLGSQFGNLRAFTNKSLVENDQMRRSSLRTLTFGTTFAVGVTSSCARGRGGARAIASRVDQRDDFFSSATGRTFLGRRATCCSTRLGLAAGT